MHPEEAVAAAGWRAEIALAYERHGGRTVLAQRRHDGPLVVQKPLYPEGDAVCHTIVVHPPGGIAGGDELDISVSVDRGASVLLTTPGAAKWYRSAGALARQDLSFEVQGTLEWLPQETILYSGALAALHADIRLARGARYLGWEVLCLGRTGSGERYAAGKSVLATRIWCDGTLVWNERGCIEGSGALLGSPAGLAGRSVCGTLLAAAPGIEDGLLVACREAAPASGDAAVTRLPGLLVARYLGDSSEAAKRYFARLWALLRPSLCGREATEPRIWRT
ncbi:MAG TPA: urease accessory protein UreD [Burkholderiales bacterium]|jgi:urease accessory protein|nr:urease accessory protein UreD [Burkholderiales bacterium]